MYVVGWAARSVESEHGEGVLDDAWEGVDDAFSEEDQLTGGDLARLIFSDDDLGTASEDVEVLIAAGVKVCGNGTIDAKDTAARGLLVGETEIGEHSHGRFGECFGEFGDVEEAAFGRHIG